MKDTGAMPVILIMLYRHYPTTSRQLSIIRKSYSYYRTIYNDYRFLYEISQYNNKINFLHIKRTRYGSK